MVICPILKAYSDIAIEKLVICELNILLVIFSHEIVGFELVEKWAFELDLTLFAG